MKKKAIVLQPHLTLPVGSTMLMFERCKYMVAAGWDVTIVSLKSKQELTAEAQRTGVKVIDVGGPVSSSIWFWAFFPYHYWKVQRVIKKLEPDCLISGAFPAIWWGWLFKFFNPATFHVFYCFEPSAFIHNKDWARSIKPDYMRWGLLIFSPLLRWIESLLHRYTDYTIAISKFTQEQIIKIYPRIDPQKISLVYCGINHTAYYPETSVERLPQILIIGVLAKFKNVDWLIRAVHTLKTAKSYEQIQLVIKGRGPEKENLLTLIAELDVQSSVQFVEQFYSSDALRHLINRSSVLVHAAHNEAFGLAAVEAMACGTPAIVTGSGGTGETVVNGVSGLYFEPGNVEDLAAKLNLLLADKTYWSKLSTGAVQRAGLFSWDETTTEFCSILNHELAKTNEPNALT